MANNSAKSRSRLDKSLPNIQGGNLPEDLHIANAKLKTELQSERNSLKQLRREKTVQLKQVREEEHQKSVLIQKDLKSRLHFEKVKELEHQRDNLNKKFDSEFQKLSKFKDGEIKKLKNDVRKLQGELQLVASSTSSNVTNGLSANTARDTFESERVKLHKEIQDLQACKRNLESEVTYLREHDKKVNYELKKIKEEHASEVTRLRKEADVEVRKLLDELKSMHRQLSQPHLDFKSKSCSVEVLGNSSSAASLERRKSRHSSNSSGEDQSSASELLGKHPPGSASWTPKISDLSSKLKHLEEKCRTLEEEKQKLQVRLKEAGRKHRPLLEKNKKFLEKNMELTSVNRSLEDKIRDISQENDKLKHALDKQEKTFTHRRYSVPIEGIGELTSDEMAKELKTLQRQGLENDKTIAALKLACAEKDRRIELILHRKRKQRTSKAQNKNAINKSSKIPELVAAGIKETYFGYDEADSNSVDDSEMSLSICSSVDMLDDEDVFEEFTREEFEANYQRLVKEHLELERSFAQLQESIGHNHVDPQRDNKLKSQLQNDLLDAQSRIEDLEKLVKSQGQKCKCKEDTGWLEEKEKLNKNIRALKEKLAGRDDKERKLNFQLEEINEQNEVLEFRTLELEEQCEKLSEQLGTSVSFTGDMSLSDSGILQMYAEEKGALEVNVCDLKESLEVLKQDHATSLSTDEKVTLVQSLALVDIADKKLKDFSNTVEALKSRIKVLEEEKAEILSKEEGVTTDLVLEYEATRNQLVELQLGSKDTHHKELEKLRREFEKLLQEKEELEADFIDYKRQVQNTSKGNAAKEIRILKGIVKNLEEEILTEKTKYQRSSNKLNQEYRQLSEEVEDLRASERNLRVRVKSLTNELNVYKRGRGGRPISSTSSRQSYSRDRNSSRNNSLVRSASSRENSFNQDDSRFSRDSRLSRTSRDSRSSYTRPRSSIIQNTSRERSLSRDKSLTGRDKPVGRSSSLTRGRSSSREGNATLTRNRSISNERQKYTRPLSSRDRPFNRDRSLSRERPFSYNDQRLRDRSSSRERTYNSHRRSPSPSAAGARNPRFDPSAYVKERERKMKEAELKKKRQVRSSWNSAERNKGPSSRSSSVGSVRSRNSSVESLSDIPGDTDASEARYSSRRSYKVLKPSKVSNSNGWSSPDVSFSKPTAPPVKDTKILASTPESGKLKVQSRISRKENVKPRGGNYYDRGDEISEIDARLNRLQEFMKSNLQT